MQLPTAPFAPVPVLFVSAAESELRAFLEEAHGLIESCPKLLTLVDGDLDAHARAKKAVRVADAEWIAARNVPLAGFEKTAQPISASRLQLAQGRPRTPAYVVMMAVLLRGFFGAGFKSWDATTMMAESMTLRVFFDNLNMTVPGRSTLTELVNAVTNKTRECILDAQIALVMKLGLDDFLTLLQDSTHVEGNSAWPTDSRTMVALTSRLLRFGGSLAGVNLPVLVSRQASKHLGEMARLNKEINMAHGKACCERERQRRYGKLLWRARRVLSILRTGLVPVENALVTLDVLPSKKLAATRVVERMRADIGALAKVIAHCEARVNKGQKVPTAEKVLSVSDPDVGFIAKGQREPVIGYKPQVARSGAGFVTALLLPQGNASDSGQLIPMVDAVVRRTTVVPTVLSVDDGYASQANVEAMKSRNIRVISINGSKGRTLTSHADWNSEPYGEARNGRSAVESLMFTLKQGFNFGEVARRGISQVHGELLEKTLAYNLCLIARTRRPVPVDNDIQWLDAAA